MKKRSLLKLVLVIVSGIVVFVTSFTSRGAVKRAIEKQGELTVLTNGDISCIAGTEQECHASDCNSPDKSTECIDPFDDHQTTANE